MAILMPEATDSLDGQRPVAQTLKRPQSPTRLVEGSAIGPDAIDCWLADWGAFEETRDVTQGAIESEEQWTGDAEDTLSVEVDTSLVSFYAAVLSDADRDEEELEL